MDYRPHSCLVFLVLLLSSCSREEPAVVVLIERAHLFERQNRLPEAVETYNRILERDPKRADVHYDRGVAYDQLENYEMSFSDYSRAIELDPGFYRAYNNRAVVLNRRGDYPAAIRDCDETLRLNPQDAFGYRNRGFARLNLKEFDAALRDFDESIQIEGKSAMSYILRGQAYQELDRHDRALEDFQQAMNLDSKLPDGYYNQAVSLAELGEYDQAQRKLDIALQIDRDIFVSPELRKLLTERPEANKTSTQPPADSGNNTETKVLSRCLEFVKSHLEKSGFSTVSIETGDSQTLRIKTMEGNESFAYFILTKGTGETDVKLPATIVNRLRSLKLPVRLLVIRQRPSSTEEGPSEGREFDLLVEDEKWLTDPARLISVEFLYQFPNADFK